MIRRAHWMLTAGLLAVTSMPTLVHAQLVSSGVACTNGGAMTTIGAIACSGAWQGNNSGAPNIPVVLSELTSDWSTNSFAGAGSVWSYLGGTDDVLDPYNTGSSTGLNGGTSGTLVLNGSQTGWFAVALKAGNAFSLYLFNGGTTGIHSVNFITDGVSYNNGHAQGLSHASMYAVSSNVTSTPEPSTAVLMVSGFVGLLLITWMRRRRTA